MNERFCIHNQLERTCGFCEREALLSALLTVVKEAQGCPPDCSHEFHRLALISIIGIAQAALNRATDGGRAVVSRTYDVFKS